MGSKKISSATYKEKIKFAHYLAEGEEIMSVFGIGNRYFWITLISYFLLVIILAVYPRILSQLLGLSVNPFFYLPAAAVGIIGLPYILKLVHLKHKMTYIFTDRRVLVKDGVLSVKLTSAPYDKITHLTVKEDFLKRISYQIGDISIHTAGPTPIETDLIKIQYPMKVKNLLEELIVRERSLLGTLKEDPLVKPL